MDAHTDHAPTPADHAPAPADHAPAATDHNAGKKVVVAVAVGGGVIAAAGVAYGAWRLRKRLQGLDSDVEALAQELAKSASPGFKLRKEKEDK